MVDATGGLPAAPADPERQRPFVGAAAGLAAGSLVVAGWYLASLGTKSQLLYLTVAIGIAVGYAANIGARRGGPLIAVIAVVLTFAGCVAGFYLVSRMSLIRRGYVHLPDEGPIPAMPSFTLVRDVLRVSVRDTIGPYLWFVAALVAAGVLGWRGLEPGARRAER